MPKIENALVLQEPDTFAKIWDDSVSLGIAKPAQNCKGYTGYMRIKEDGLGRHSMLDSLTAVK